ncbi:MAG TPA: cob(I)yrinic acid a,c-diamide adenosyltransferase [Gemmatimonadaceae bacterium]|jgi:cob(I)alamin adenosyltransferase
MTEPRTDPLEPPEKPTPASGRKAPVPKQKKPGQYRVPPRKDRHGLIIVNTGDGKGKTTAALGLLLRASGRDMRVAMYQFVKRMDDAGEHRAATRLGLEILPLGAGCTLDRDDVRDDATLAQLGWEHCRELIAAGTYDVLILDELTLPLSWGWIKVADVVNTLKARPVGTHIVISGRGAPDALIEAADLVTDMRMIKHPYAERGLRAQAGIDV